MFCDWRPSQYDRRKFLVKGTELATAIVPGTLSRFQLCEIRSISRDGYPERRIAVRDASTVTDEDTRNGKRPAIVAWFDDEPEALEAIMCAMQLQWRNDML